MSSKKFKYRINELLDNLSVSKRRLALAIIHNEHVQQKTFSNYRNILLGDKQDIPHEIVDKLEKLFNLNPGELQNFDNSAIRPIADRPDDNAAMAAELGLTKN